MAKLSAKDAGRSHELMAAETPARRAGSPSWPKSPRRHAMWAPLTEGQRPETWEQKVVYYADRIAQHDRLVGIDARMLEIAQRRPELRDRIDEYRVAALRRKRKLPPGLT